MYSKRKDLFRKATGLRKRGYSLNEISKKLGISKSTASLWLRDAVVCEDGKKRLTNLSKRGTIRGRNTRAKQKKKYLLELQGRVNVLFERIKNKDKSSAKIYLALLYWCEGSKTERRLVFMNSDPEMIMTYLLLLRRSYNLDENKFTAFLHLHSYHNKNRMLDFWSKLTKIDKSRISVYNKVNSGKRRKKDYKGCISVRYGDVRVLDEIMLIVRSFMKNV